MIRRRWKWHDDLRCRGTTKAGQRCRLRGSIFYYCWHHRLPTVAEELAAERERQARAEELPLDDSEDE